MDKGEQALISVQSNIMSAKDMKKLDHYYKLISGLQGTVNSRKKFNLGLFYGLFFGIIGNLFIYLIFDLYGSRMSENLKFIILMIILVVILIFLLGAIIENKEVNNHSKELDYLFNLIVLREKILKGKVNQGSVKY